MERAKVDLGLPGTLLSPSLRTECITWRSYWSRSLGLLSVPSSACEQSLANTHTQQCSDLCISTGVSGTVCLCCWTGRRATWNQTKAETRKACTDSSTPPTEVAALCMAFLGGARPGYTELTGFSPQAHKWPVAPNTKQSLGSSTVLSVSSFPAIFRGVFHKEIEPLMLIEIDSTARSGWQKRVAKSEVWVWELRVGGWDMSFYEG